MLFKKKKDIIQKVYGPTKKYYNFNKIMFISCIQINLNKYKLTYVIDHLFFTSDSVSLLKCTIYVDNYVFNKIMALGFGKWIKLNNSNIYFYYYIYQDKDNKLIYKCTKTDNGLKVNSSNSYGHQLIYKALIYNNQIIES